MKKVYSIIFRGPVCDVLKNYLSYRSQVAVINGMKTASSKLPLKAGVPQSSIVSPLLFNLFVDDFPQIISNAYYFNTPTTLSCFQRIYLTTRPQLLYRITCTKLCRGSQITVWRLTREKQNSSASDCN